MISKLGSRRSASPVAPATGFGRVIPARVRPQTSQTYYHRNQQYSIVGLTNAAGTLVERYTYSAYGTLGIYAANGTVRSSSTYANRYTYTGREWDSELRLYHFRARWYDPATGGFVTRDPLGYVDGMSLYRGYFGVRGVDTEGLASQESGNKTPAMSDTFTKLRKACEGESRSNAVKSEEYTKRANEIRGENPSLDWMNLDRRKAHCKELVSGTLPDSVAQLLNMLRSNRCVVSISCKCCNDALAKFFPAPAQIEIYSGTPGKLDRIVGQITLCLPDFDYPQHIFDDTYLDALHHELIHANQRCRGFGYRSCSDNLKTEMEAYYCAGQCGQDMWIGTAAWDCLERAIESSCPKPCQTLTEADIVDSITRFLHRAADQTNMCDFGPGRQVL